MKKKIIIIASAAVLVAVLFCALAPCIGGLTPFQAMSVKRFLKTNPFLSTQSNERVELSVAAAVGTNGYERNTFVGSRIQMEGEPDYIEMNLVTDDSGRLVLADSYFDANEKSIDAYRVAKSLIQTTEHPSLLVNLAEYTDLNAAATLLMSSSRFANAAVRGVEENTIAYVRSFFPSHTVLCEYSHKNKLSLAEIKAKGADGIYCSASMLSTHFAKKVQDAGLALWVDCGDSTYRVIKAMSHAKNVDGIVTAKPTMAMNLQNAWSYDDYQQMSRQQAKGY